MTQSRALPWDVVVDLFLCRDPEELKKAEEAQAIAAEEAQTHAGWGEAPQAPVEPTLYAAEPVVPAAANAEWTTAGSSAWSGEPGAVPAASNWDAPVSAPGAAGWD